MTVTLRKPTSKEYKNFSMAVKQRAKLKNITFTYGEEEVSILLFIIILFYIHISHRGLNSVIYYQPPLYTQLTYGDVEVGIPLFIIILLFMHSSHTQRQRFEFFYLLLASFIYIVHIRRGRGGNFFIYYQPLYLQSSYILVHRTPPVIK